MLFRSESCEDPPIDAYLNDVGLVLSPEPASHHSAGWQFEAKGTCLARVIRGGPAERAGLQVADEVLAIDHQRLRNPEDSSFHFTSADERSVLFCRDGRVRETKLRPDGPAIERWRLRHAESAGEEAAGARARWLALLP